VQDVERGLPFESLEKLAALSGLPVPLLASVLAIPERTLARRRGSGRLTPGESERLLRISTVFQKSVQLFEGDIAGAVNWLTRPQRALNDETPLHYSRTEIGAREVEDLIGRLEHGVFS
jgi:putative toxin-antitoxin system antitoxin component (TIGR02293 family)